MSHYSLLILLSTWSQSETIAASECFKYIWFSYHESWNRKDHGSEYWTGCNIKIRWGGGGGKGSQKSFPSYSLFCGLFQTPSQSLKSLFFTAILPIFKSLLTTFFSYLKIPKTYDPILWKIQPIIVNTVTKKRPHPAVHPHRPFIRKQPLQNKTKELSGIHKVSLVYFRSNFSWEGGGGASNLGWSRYSFVSHIRLWFRWSRIRVIIKKKKKMVYSLTCQYFVV